MEESEVFSCLCYYDIRNPYYVEEDRGVREECSCDNCFYGRSVLANYILVLFSKLDGGS